MKHMLLLLGALATGSVSAQTTAAGHPSATTHTQTSMVRQSQASASKDAAAPAKVTAAFSEKYPKATAVVWKETKNNNWKANFSSNGTNMTAWYDANGQWGETASRVAQSAVPEAVTKTIKDKFADYTPGNFELKEYPSRKAYAVDLKNGSTRVMVTIDPDGKVLNQKTMNAAKK